MLAPYAPDPSLLPIANFQMRLYLGCVDLHGDDNNENTVGHDRHNTRRRVNSLMKTHAFLISLTTPIIGVV